MHGVSSGRTTSAWFHTHPRGGDLIELLAAIVETLSRSFEKNDDPPDALPSTPPMTTTTTTSTGGALHHHHPELPLTSSPNDRHSGAAARFDPRLHAISPPGVSASSSRTFSTSPSHPPPLQQPPPSPKTLYLLKMALGSLFRVTVDAAPAKTFLLDRHPRFLTTVLTLVDRGEPNDLGIDPCRVLGHSLVRSLARSLRSLPRSWESE